MLYRVHDKCRGKNLIPSFNRIGVSISYDDVLRIRNDLAAYTVEVSQDNVPIPCHFQKDKFITAAFDHNEATLSGLDSIHDTVTVLFQEKSPNVPKKPKLTETTVSHKERTFKDFSRLFSTFLHVNACQRMSQHTAAPFPVTSGSLSVHFRYISQLFATLPHVNAYQRMPTHLNAYQRSLSQPSLSLPVQFRSISGPFPYL